MAKQVQGTDAWLAVCGSTGLRYIKLAEDKPANANDLEDRNRPPPVDASRDCPYCQLGAKGAALLQTRFSIHVPVLLAPAPSVWNTALSYGGLFWPVPMARPPPLPLIA